MPQQIEIIHCHSQHEQASSNHLCNQNSLPQTLNNYIHTNLLACISHHRRWLVIFTKKLVPAAKQKESACLAHNPCRLFWLYYRWQRSPALRAPECLTCKTWCYARRKPINSAHVSRSYQTHRSHTLPIVNQTLLQLTRWFLFSTTRHSR